MESHTWSKFAVHLQIAQRAKRTSYRINQDSPIFIFCTTTVADPGSEVFEGSCTLVKLNFLTTIKF